MISASPLPPAAAGVIVGSLSLTGCSQRHSANSSRCCPAAISSSLLLLVAVMSLVLGMGLPTTANYIVVSALDGTGDRDARRQERPDRAADRGPSVRLLFRHPGGRYAARGPRRLRRGRHFGRRPDPHRRPGLHVRYPHGPAAVPVHLQHGTAADRRLGGQGGDRLCHCGRRHDAVRGGDPGLFLRPQPDLGDRDPAARRLQPVPAGLLARPGRTGICRAAGRGNRAGRRKGARGRHAAGDGLRAQLQRSGQVSTKPP